jgi:hypothetical protein
MLTKSCDCATVRTVYCTPHDRFESSIVKNSDESAITIYKIMTGSAFVLLTHFFGKILEKNIIEVASIRSEQRFSDIADGGIEGNAN